MFCSFSYLDVIENYYCVGSKKEDILLCHKEGTDALQALPQNWTLDHDEDLAHFLCSHIETQNDNLGSIKNYVESIIVSSTSVSIILRFKIDFNRLHI